MHDPKYAFLLLVDEPHPKRRARFATAGWTVVPAASRIIERIGADLGVPRSTKHLPRSLER